MRKIVASILTIGLVASLTVGATRAYLDDTETSANNTFTAGTLDLVVDGENPLTSAKFSVTNMKPDSQPKGTFNLLNDGTVNGFIDIEGVTVSNNENSCLEPETEAGDSTCGTPGLGEGELQNVVNVRLFNDFNCDGWISAGDTTFYNGLVNGLASNYELNTPLNAGQNTCVTAIFDWWSTPNDNKAMGDDMALDMTFELGQTTGQ